MALSYLPVDRSQPFLLPPDMAEWLPASHLVWFVLDVVAKVDTSSGFVSIVAPQDGRELDVDILSTGERPLLGTMLLDGHDLTIQFAEGGAVTIELL